METVYRRKRLAGTLTPDRHPRRRRWRRSRIGAPRGDGWRSIPGPGSAHVIAGAPNGALWLGYYGRVTRLEGKAWKRYWLKGQVKGIAAGRGELIWAATRYGLAVLKGQRWQWRRMEDSELPSNDLAGVAVLGAGSPLPRPLTKPSGSLKLRLEWDTGDSVDRALVELCAAPPSIVLRSSRSPCRGQPLRRVSKTDTLGLVQFTSLPEHGPQWLIISSARRTRVTAGQKLDIGTWRLRAAEHKRRLPCQ